MSSNDKIIYKDLKTYCCEEPKLKPLFSNIKEYDFLEPIKRLANIFNECIDKSCNGKNYYNHIAEKYKKDFFIQLIIHTAP